MVSIKPKANILLVDDHLNNLIALEAILEPMGHNLVRAESGKDALKHLLTTDFALILMDAQMPILDGFETAVLIKEREKSRYIPIIFITAINTEQQNILRGYTAGAVDYLSKPVNAEILKSKVNVFVDLFLQREEIKHQAQLLHDHNLKEAKRKLVDRERRLERRHLLEMQEQADRQRSLLTDVLASVTQGRLLFCKQTGDLPKPLEQIGGRIGLHAPQALQTLRHCTKEVAISRGYPQGRWQDLVTAAHEAAMNAIVHAGGGEARICMGHEDKIQVWVEDHGGGIPLDRLPRATLERGYSTSNTLGHGFWLMLNIADRIFLQTATTGTIVVVEQELLPPSVIWQ